MRISLLTLLAVPLLGASLARAGKGGKAAGDPGALGKVSAGMGRATGAGSVGGTDQDQTRGGGYREHQLDSQCPDPDLVHQRRPQSEAERRLLERCFRRVAILTGDPTSVEARYAAARYNHGRARLDFYGAVQTVHDSDGSWTLEAGVHDRRFRLAFSMTRFFEEQGDGSRLTLSMPALIGSVRVDDGWATRVDFQLGIVGAKTRHDPMTDSSVAGGVAGVRVEHVVARRTTLFGEAQAMVFDSSVRASSLRGGIRIGPLEASFRTLDFNVGPPLFGPEVGLRF